VCLQVVSEWLDEGAGGGVGGKNQRQDEANVAASRVGVAFILALIANEYCPDRVAHVLGVGGRTFHVSHVLSYGTYLP